MCGSRYIPPRNQLHVKKWFLGHLYFFLHQAKRMKLGNPYLAVIFSQMCANRLQWQCKI